MVWTWNDLWFHRAHWNCVVEALLFKTTGKSLVDKLFNQFRFACGHRNQPHHFVKIFPTFCGLNQNCTNKTKPKWKQSKPNAPSIYDIATWIDFIDRLHSFCNWVTVFPSCYLWPVRGCCCYYYWFKCSSSIIIYTRTCLAMKFINLLFKTVFNCIRKSNKQPTSKSYRYCNCIKWILTVASKCNTNLLWLFS